MNDMPLMLRSSRRYQASGDPKSLNQSDRKLDSVKHVSDRCVKFGTIGCPGKISIPVAYKDHKPIVVSPTPEMHDANPMAFLLNPYLVFVKCEANTRVTEILQPSNKLVGVVERQDNRLWGFCLLKGIKWTISSPGQADSLLVTVDYKPAACFMGSSLTISTKTSAQTAITKGNFGQTVLKMSDPKGIHNFTMDLIPDKNGDYKVKTPEGNECAAVSKTCQQGRDNSNKKLQGQIRFSDRSTTIDDRCLMLGCALFVCR